MTVYTVTLPFDRLKIRADLSQASSPIQYLADGDDDDRHWVPTPYQVADARHDEVEAAVLAVKYLGSEYYLDPADDSDDLDHDAYVRRLILSIEADEDDEDDED